MARLTFVDGEQVQARERIADLSGDDPTYIIEPGDRGTIRSAGTFLPSREDFAVEWDKFPGQFNVVSEENLSAV